MRINNIGWEDTNICQGNRHAIYIRGISNASGQ